MKKIGIIGAGQLAAMMGMAARPLSLSIGVLPDASEDPAIAIADYVAKDIADLVEWSEVITFENEFIDISSLQLFAQQGCTFLPSLESLSWLIDKYQQRRFLTTHHIPTPQFFPIAASPDTQARDIPVPVSTFPAVLKSCTHGYDGKGTHIVTSAEALFRCWQDMGSPPAIVESFVDFAKELAIIVGRSVTGEISLFPVVETQQEQQVCRRVIAPAPIDPIYKTEIEELAKAIVTHLDYVGVLGIEFFLTQEGKLLVNEMAPRTHNSGHVTIESCVTSQFAQLLRIVSGLPMGKTDMVSPVAVMVNLLGQEVSFSGYEEQRRLLAQLPHTFVHWYGKRQSRPGRKLGHVTALVNSYAQASARMRAIEEIWCGA